MVEIGAIFKLVEIFQYFYFALGQINAAKTFLAIQIRKLKTEYEYLSVCVLLFFFFQSQYSDFSSAAQVHGKRFVIDATTKEKCLNDPKCIRE